MPKTLVPEEVISLPVAPDYDQIVKKAQRVSGAIDKHLDYEAKHRRRDIYLKDLCPEQRRSLVSDLAEMTRE